MKKLIYLIIGGAMLILTALCIFGMFAVYGNSFLEVSIVSKIVLNIIAVISAVICVTAIKVACGQK